MLHPFFETLTECMTEELFLREFSKKYYYEEPQLPALAAVAASMQKSIVRDVQAGLAGWSCQGDGGIQSGVPDGNNSAPECGVCITLGPGIDALQEDYLQQGLLSEAYMVETLASELLLKAYPQWNDWVAAQGKYHVRRYHFLGSEVKYSLEGLPKLLKELEVPVSCTPAYCMLPKKSVAFYAELTEEQDVSCEGICAGCGNQNCPNRMEKGRMGHATDMTDRPFTYGYRQIFGLK